MSMSQPAIVIARKVDVDDVHHRVAAICARLAADHAALVELTRDVLDGELWAEGGIRSPKHWLVVRAGLSPAHAADVLALARRAQELPEALDAMGEGRLGLDQAAVIARHVPAAYSRQATELAELATVPQLRRSLSRYAFDEGAQPEAPEEPGTPALSPQTERARLSMSTVDGRFHLSYSAPASVAALVEAALREAKDALFQAGTKEASLADGLAEVARRSLAQVDGTARASRFRIYVHLDTDGGWIRRGGRLPSAMTDALTCDGILQPVWETNGTPVNVGRAQRVVPDRTRRLVESRDQGCRYPGCTVTGHVEAHHLVHWRNGGRTDLDHLISLCPFHHDRHHEGEFSISGSPATPGGLTFWARGGWPLQPLAPRGSPARVGAPPAGPACWTGPTGERLQTRHLCLAVNPPDPSDAPSADSDVGQPATNSRRPASRRWTSESSV